ncbi:MAG: 50S ribosomal protein L21 [Ktedonobacteraceae bacterium]|nr:50S ribosomal protein L21 [Ktedonobacteraceae bacterium]MBV9019316.1 50S ribosomal protein L21 [Ktedonobacteraceae bacterium]
MYAVIKSGGRQYKVSVGQKLEVNRLHVEDGAQVRFDEVLLISDAERLMVGAPFVENAAVLATAVKQMRGPKLIVFRYKPKKRFRHKRGHRQELTALTIDDILADGKSLITGEEPRPTAVAPDEGMVTDPVTDTVAPGALDEEDIETDTEKRPALRRTAQAESTESSTEE